MIIGELEQELLFHLTPAYLFTLIKGNARFWNKDFKYETLNMVNDGCHTQDIVFYV